jgi:ketosteroid isomerase-like protein
MRTSKNTAMRIGISMALVAIATRTMAVEPASEVAAIIEVDRVAVKAYNSGDVDTVVAQYAPDAVLLPPGLPRSIGQAAIRAYYKADMAQAAREGTGYVIGPNVEGGASGDLGWASGTYDVRDRAGHTRESGKFLSVFRKIDGRWHYLRDTWNADGTPSSAQPAVPGNQ